MWTLRRQRDSPDLGLPQPRPAARTGRLRPGSRHRRVRRPCHPSRAAPDTRTPPRPRRWWPATGRASVAGAAVAAGSAPRSQLWPWPVLPWQAQEKVHRPGARLSCSCRTTHAPQPTGTFRPQAVAGHHVRPSQHTVTVLLSILALRRNHADVRFRQNQGAHPHLPHQSTLQCVVASWPRVVVVCA